jgi:hypothetical protein
MAAKYSDDEYEHDSDDEYDEDIGMWVGNPLKYADHDDEGNYKDKEEKEEKETRPLAASEPKAHSDSVKSETRKDKLKRLMREKWIREREERKPVTVATVVVTAPKMDADLAAARRGLPYAWEAHLSKTHGEVFYYNRQTGERVWIKPRINDVGRGVRKSARKKRSRAKQSKRKRSMKRRTIRRK